MKYRAIYGKTGCIAEFKDGELVWAADEYLHPQSSDAPMIMPDIQPYQSQIDGTMITSRSQHRSHLRQHGCFEIGNETKHLVNRAGPLQAPPGLKRKLVEIANAKLRPA